MPFEIVTAIPPVPRRSAQSHKGTFGHVLCVAGSRSLSGAAALTGIGALRGGAGLVTVAVPEMIQATVASHNPCYMTIGLASEPTGVLSTQAEPVVMTAARDRDVLAIGPGLGQGQGPMQVVASLVARSAKPTVLDADGINLIAGRPEILRRRGTLVLTPHPGEFSRLIGLKPDAILADRENLASKFAADFGCTVVLKGHSSIVTNGKQLYRNTTGNPGMATGGTGDVLTGLIAALIAQGMDPFPAAVLGVHVHGKAGDLTRDNIGEIGLTARDLVDNIPLAFKLLAESQGNSP